MANNPATMTTKQIYSHLATLRYPPSRADRLVELFAKAAGYLVDKIENEKWMWRDNYMREHAGCSFGAEFSNSISPYINELVFRKYPKFQKYKNGDDSDDGDDLFVGGR